MRLDCTGPQPRIDLDALSPPPTADQRRALVFDREIAVTAGAGAGKTQTLSLRYAVLLLSIAVDAVVAAPSRPRPDVEQVLVLTFTEKAAEEMADRCYRRLLALGRAVRDQADALEAAYGEGFGRSLAASVDHLLDTFDRAAISTFHGFCSRLLREQPAETGTPPGFQVLEEPDAVRVRDEAIEGALQALYAERPTELAPLYDAFGRRDALVTALRSILGEGARLVPRLRRYAAGEVTLDEWLAQQPVPPHAVRAWLTDVAAPLVTSLSDLLAPGGSAWASDVLGPLRDSLADLPDDPLARNRLYRAVLDAFVTGSGAACKARTLGHASVLGTKASWPSAPAYTQAKASVVALQEALDDFVERLDAAGTLLVPADRVLLVQLGSLSRLGLDALARQRDALDAERGVDFTAMQERAVRAVCDDAGLREQLSARHRYLMVDEFQDTDESQWALVRALGRPPGRPRDRIFVVGDVKQAIYGFRGGDVTVFDAATQELEVEPVVLGDNFRSRDDLITWFNAAFTSILGPPDPERPAWEAPYEPLRAGRGAPGGSVTLVAHEHDGRAAEVAADEADAIARWIAAAVLADDGPVAGPWHDRDVHPTPPVALLLRRRTHQPMFERALRAQGVPFVVARGVGFWSRPEVLDLVNAVHALATDDPISMVGLLRSPLLCVPDDELFAFVGGRSDRLRRFGRGAAPAEAPPHLARAWSRYAVLRGARDRVPVSALLRLVVSEGVAWHAWGLEDGAEVAQANALRLIDLAARFDSRGADGLEAVADWCLARVDAAEREDEAVVLPTAARVVLMTVHAAKGLEFPIVVVPQCGVSSAPPAPPLTIRRAPSGWDLAFPVADALPAPGTGARGVRCTVHPGRLTLLRAIRDAEESAEDLRLLYVAATRAKDHLVLVGHCGSNSPRRGSWLGHLAKHHEWPLEAGDGARVIGLDALGALAPPSRQAAPPPAPPPPRRRGVDRPGPGAHRARGVAVEPRSLRRVPGPLGAARGAARARGHPARRRARGVVHPARGCTRRRDPRDARGRRRRRPGRRRRPVAGAGVRRGVPARRGRGVAARAARAPRARQPRPRAASGDGVRGARRGELPRARGRGGPARADRSAVLRPRRGRVGRARLQVRVGARGARGGR